MLRSKCLFVGLVVIMTGCERTPPTTPRGADEPNFRVLKLFGGQAGWSPIARRTRVEAFRVDPNWQGESDPEKAAEEHDRKFAGYSILSGPIDVEKKTANALAMILADPATYDWESAKGCEFQPGVGIRFIAADSSTEILFCFSCDELQILRDGKSVGHEDTDTARAELVEIVKKIFPDDKVIQGLDANG